VFTPWSNVTRIDVSVTVTSVTAGAEAKTGPAVIDKIVMIFKKQTIAFLTI